MGMKWSWCLKTWLGGCQQGVLGSQCGLLLLGRRAGNGPTEDTVLGVRITQMGRHVWRYRALWGRGAHPRAEGAAAAGSTRVPKPPYPPRMGCPRGAHEVPPLGKPQWPCLLLLRGKIGTMGLGICPTLSLIPRSRFWGPSATSQNPGGGGVQRSVCVCVYVCVCVRAHACACAHVCCSPRLSVFCQTSYTHWDRSLWPWKRDTSPSNIPTTDLLRSSLSWYLRLCFPTKYSDHFSPTVSFITHTAQLLFFWPLGQIHSPSSSQTRSPFKTLWPFVQWDSIDVSETISLKGNLGLVSSSPAIFSLNIKVNLKTI